MSGTDHTTAVHELVAAIESDGHRFMEAHASLPTVARALIIDDRYGARGPRNLHRPIACYLLGDYDQALALLDDPKSLIPAYIKARFRRQIEHAAGRPITEEAPAIEQPPDVPPWPSEPQPREIRHRETGVVLLRLNQPIEFRANLRGANLAGADLAGLKALGADFRRANLTGARLDQAELLGPDLRDTNLAGASLRGVRIDVSNAHRVNLSDADLRDAHLKAVFLHRAKLTGADLRGATIAQSDLMQANLRGADLRGAKCPNTVFSGADLREAKLEGIHLGAEGSSGPARYDGKTRWPEGFEPQSHGAISDPAGPIIWRL